MKSAVAEISKISESLPAKKASELLRFARALAASAKPKRKTAELDGDAEWERIISDPRPRPKLEAVRKRLAKLDREGKLETLDFKKFSA
jgi:hypothetical protein